MTLATRIHPDDSPRFDKLLEASVNAVKDAPPGRFQPIRPGDAHLTWHFFGVPCANGLDELCRRLKKAALGPESELDDRAAAILFFDRPATLAPGRSGRKPDVPGKKITFCLEPAPECIPAIRDIRTALERIFDFPPSRHFRPHLTIARVRNPEKWNESWRPRLEAIWSGAGIRVRPDHYLVFRRLDHHPHQPVFGIRTV
jgi:hypothetical protein